MDLITHIPGVGPTGAVNPGATTPAPYSVPQLGMVDGVGPGSATRNMAEIYNRDLLWRRALIATSGLAFDPTNWIQEVQALQVLLGVTGSRYAVAAGTPDAITAAFTPAIASLANTFTVYVRAGAANTVVNPTLKADGTALKTIVKGNNLALVAGDIAGAGHWLELQYDVTLDKYVLQNPATGVNPAVPFASNAEAQAFAVTTKAISPATLAAALQGGNQSLGASGYQKLPGGLILQWGSVFLAGSGSSVITYPVAFTTATYTITSVGSANATGGYIDVPTATGFTLSNGSNSAQTVYWMAIGK